MDERWASGAESESGERAGSTVAADSALADAAREGGAGAVDRGDGRVPQRRTFSAVEAVEDLADPPQRDGEQVVGGGSGAAEGSDAVDLGERVGRTEGPERADGAETEPAEVVEVPGPERRMDIENRVEERVALLSVGEREQVEALAADHAVGGTVDSATMLEALDAWELARLGFLSRPLRRAGPGEDGVDVVDGDGRPWDHKTAWSGPDFDPVRVADRWHKKDLGEGESLIVNIERLNLVDRAALRVELANMAVEDRVVFYPPEQW